MCVVSTAVQKSCELFKAIFFHAAAVDALNIYNMKFVYFMAFFPVFLPFSAEFFQFLFGGRMHKLVFGSVNQTKIDSLMAHNDTKKKKNYFLFSVLFCAHSVRFIVVHSPVAA